MNSFLWSHWYPWFGLLVMSALDFKAKVDPLTCFITCKQWNPQIHLWCDTCWPLDGQHGGQTILIHVPVPCRNFSNFCLIRGFFEMVAYEKIYFEAYTDDQNIWHKNNIAQLDFVLGTAELCLNFSSWLRDVHDIYWIPVVHMVKTHFLLENLWISGASLDILEKFQCSWALPNVKYNCAILFLLQMYWSSVYASKYIFS